MKSSRRKFLKIAGLSALTLGVKPVVDVVTNSDPEVLAQNLPEYQHTPEQLKAKHWGMVIDTRKFESPEQYEKIIEACHSFHNVPDIPGKQDIKWIWATDYEQAFTDKHSHFPSEAVESREYLLMCNHCEHPPCVRACPTEATFKRSSDGIVIMDMHRCIGCRFCMAACPFGARSFNFKDPRPFIKEENPEYPTRMRGVVEKCNFCAERLAKGMNPACVDAAAEHADGAIIFGDLADPDSNVRQALSENFAIRRKTSLGTQPSVYYII